MWLMGSWLSPVWDDYPLHLFIATAAASRGLGPPRGSFDFTYGEVQSELDEGLRMRLGTI